MKILSILAAAALAAIAAPAMAQTAPGVPGEALAGQGAATSATSTVTGKPIKLPEVLALCDGGGPFVACSAYGGKREFFQLATANVPSAPVTVYGGDYIIAQTCTTYGSVNLRVLGPDGATRSIVLTKSAADGNGGTGVAFGSYASIDVTLTNGAAGCYVTASRVPS